MILIKAFTRECRIRQLGNFVGIGSHRLKKSAHLFPRAQPRRNSARCHRSFEQALNVGAKLNPPRLGLRCQLCLDLRAQFNLNHRVSPEPIIQRMLFRFISQNTKLAGFTSLGLCAFWVADAVPSGRWWFATYRSQVGTGASVEIAWYPRKPGFAPSAGPGISFWRGHCGAPDSDRFGFGHSGL